MSNPKKVAVKQVDDSEAITFTCATCAICGSSAHLYDIWKGGTRIWSVCMECAEKNYNPQFTEWYD